MASLKPHGRCSAACGGITRFRDPRSREPGRDQHAARQRSGGAPPAPAAAACPGPKPLWRCAGTLESAPTAGLSSALRTACVSAPLSSRGKCAEASVPWCSKRAVPDLQFYTLPADAAPPAAKVLSSGALERGTEGVLREGEQVLSFCPLAKLYTGPRMGCQCRLNCSASDKFKPSALSAAGTRPLVPAPSYQSPQTWPAPS